MYLKFAKMNNWMVYTEQESLHLRHDAYLRIEADFKLLGKLHVYLLILEKLPNFTNVCSAYEH